jgi:hypothetical protein
LRPRKNKRSRPAKKPTQAKSDFVSVARELGCDEDKGRFERQLEKIAKAKVTTPIKGSRAK